MRPSRAFSNRLCPADLLNLAPGRQRYTQLLNDDGGIVDDLMVTRPPGADGRLRLVVNASRKEVDFALMRAASPAGVRLTPLPEAALIALQGPLAAATLARARARRGHRDDAVHERATGARSAEFETFVSRSGYTGEDGYEISLASTQAESFARLLLSEPDVAPIGLGARDSLRLEAGLCLYGHELDETIDPIEAGSPGRSRSAGASKADFPARSAFRTRWRTGRPASAWAFGRTAARPRARARKSSRPTARRSASSRPAGSARASARRSRWAMSRAPMRRVGTPIGLMVRGKPLSARVVALPFHPHAYYRGLS